MDQLQVGNKLLFRMNNERLSVAAKGSFLVAGEVELRIRDVSGGVARLDVLRVGLYGPIRWRGAEGDLSLTAQQGGTGEIGAGGELQMEFPALVQFGLRGQSAGYSNLEKIQEDFYTPPREA